MIDDVLPGIYRHQKGNTYTVLCSARQSTNGLTGRDVIYVSHTTGEVNTRDSEEFQEVVRWPDGRMLPRFIRLESLKKKDGT